MTAFLEDRYHRPLRDLRISVTDRCNFRCTYCMPKEIFGDDFQFLPKQELLTYEEIVTLAEHFVSLGVKKIRITGGEPLLRKDLHKLVKQIWAIDGVEDVALTTNGLLLHNYAESLYDAGLRRLNISLDALDPSIFGKMNGRGIEPDLILKNIDAAVAMGFKVKVNMVVQKGVNDGEILPMAEYFKDRNVTLRYIEFMDVGNDNGWSLNQVVTKQEMLRLLEQEYKLEPVKQAYFGEVAKNYRYSNSTSTIGFITSISESFCSSCTRARLSSDGKMYNCLFATKGFDLRSLLRNHASDEELRETISHIWAGRNDRYSDERSANTVKLNNKIGMSYIGG